MSRHEVHDLTVRVEPSGDKVEKFENRPNDDLQGHDRVVLLVHGYNTTAHKATKEYRKFIRLVRGSHIIGRFYWPGYVGIPYWIPLLGARRFLGFSEASYPWQIVRAIQSARQLANCLRQLTGPKGRPANVFLLAHSLGGRLVLEMLQIFARRSNWKQPKFSGVCLMAPAVPVAMLKSDGRLYNGGRRAAKLSVLHSDYDVTLYSLFPPGQTVAAQIYRRPEEGLWPTAVGRTGETGDVRAKAERVDMLGHGHYWGSPTAANYVAAMLGASVPWTAPSHGTPPHATAPAWSPQRHEIAR